MKHITYREYNLEFHQVDGMFYITAESVDEFFRTNLCPSLQEAIDEIKAMCDEGYI